MYLQKKLSLIAMAIILVIIISIFTYARAFISIGTIILISIFIFTKNKRMIFNENKSLYILLTMGAFYIISITYSWYIVGSINIKDIVSIHNPFIGLILVLAIYKLLTKKEAEYIIFFFIALVGLISTLCMLMVIFSGGIYLINGIYDDPRIQFFVALVFPLSALIFLNKVINGSITNRYTQALFIFLSFSIIFTDLTLNKSKLGFLIELIILSYYIFVLLKFNISIFKKIIFILSLISFIAILFTSLYSYSTIFKERVQPFFDDAQVLYSGDYNSEEMSAKSTGLRFIYYTTSLKIFKNEPLILLTGCSSLGYSNNIEKCSSDIIDNNNLLKRDNKVTIVSPHNEFINYIYQSGIVTAILFTAFLISLFFYESKRLSKEMSLYLKVLVFSFFMGCMVDYFMSNQMITTSFFILLGCILTTKNNNVDN